MQVKYIHTYTITVEGNDSFNDHADLDHVVKEGDRDASYNTIFVKHGGLDPKPVRSTRHTQTVIVHEVDK